MHGQPARFGLATMLAVVLLLALAGVAGAQTFTVSNLSDSGVGSLRGEVAAANTNPGADTVNFASGLSGTITFSGTGIVISDPIDIEGPGPSVITVSQTAAHRVFEVEANGGEAVTIAGLHIANGTAPNSGANPELGGNIFNAGSDLTLANDLISGGNADEGGGVDSADGPLTLRSSTISGNHAVDDVGLLAGGPNAGWTVQDSTIAGNSATAGEAGAALQTEGVGLIEDSTISGNTAKEDAGLSLTAVAAGRITIRNSTIADNTASKAIGGVEISIGASAGVAIEDSTIAANHAEGGVAGGIRFDSGSGLSIDNSIVATNTASGKGPDIYSEGGTLKSAFDLIGKASVAQLNETVPGSDLLGIDPGLGALADNGGPTETMALIPTSAAVNKGSSTVAGDQRDLARPVAYPGIANSTAPGANGADIGAFELQIPAPPSPASGASAVSNHFKLGKLKLNRSNGTALIAIAVPGPGIVRLVANKQLKGAKKIAKRAGTVKLLIRPKGKALGALHHVGRAKVKAVLSFTPNGGTAASVMRKLRLVEAPTPTG